MFVYFSCSITGGRKDQPVYQLLVEALTQDGHFVPTAHLSDENILALEKVAEPADIYRRDVDWVTDCDAVVAEVSTPSHGVGYEIALAESLGKPIFCCYQKGSRVSKMILGNPSPLFHFCCYSHPEEAVKDMRVFLKAVGRE
jgi:2'-deoxynucleoside 5'-phosphate N-hydrolase